MNTVSSYNKLMISTDDSIQIIAKNRLTVNETTNVLSTVNINNKGILLF